MAAGQNDPVSVYLSTEHYGVVDATPESDLHYFLYLADSPRPLLDVGCNVGNLLAIDPERSVGVDVDPNAVDICQKRGLRASAVNLNDGLPFEDASFGTVHCRHVIEHVREPISLMREMRRVLRPDGLLVLLTPDFRHAYRTFYDDHTHIRPQTRESLRRLALDSGFRATLVRHEVSRVGIRQLVRRRKLSASNGRLLYEAAYRLGLRQRKTLLVLARVTGDVPTPVG